MKWRLIIAVLLFNLSAESQKPYQLNDKVTDFPIPDLLNDPESSSHFYKLAESNITILDFFGTWCVPCIKALPHLAALQEKFKGKVKILLISNEQKDRLEKFVSSRQPFPFPVVVDKENSITNLFVPPSYPYTVVLNKEKNIITLTDAASITEGMVNEWLKGKVEAVSEKPLSAKIEIMSTSSNFISFNKLVQLSQEFMYAAKTGDSITSYIQSLAAIEYSALKNQLTTDDEKKAFWINLYNGFTQVLLKQNPDQYKTRGKFFGNRQIKIAGQFFSLDDIEHGILRRSKIKWSLGHLNKWFPNKTEKQLRVEKLDYRLHFALNCGAKSCPPIAFYKPENLNPQLELATTAYLKGEVAYDAAKNSLQLPAILSWFRRDFGGKKGIIQLLKQKGIIPAESNPGISFKRYDWTLYIDNYKN